MIRFTILSATSIFARNGFFATSYGENFLDALGKVISLDKAKVLSENVVEIDGVIYRAR